MKIKTKSLEILLDVTDDRWNAGMEILPERENGVETIRLSLSAERDLPPPVFTLTVLFPQKDVYSRWMPDCDLDRKRVFPTWCDNYESHFSKNAPEITLIGKDGSNRLTLAFSEALRLVQYGAGIDEHTSVFHCFFRGFTVPEAPVHSYTAELRIDTRDIFYADAIRSAFDWFSTFPEYKPAEVPAAALEMLYSSWYSYHKDGLCADVIEKEAYYAAALGMKTIIVDDGWQCDRYDGGPYAYCGDWEPAVSRFPDMKKHVSNVHKAGLRYLLWVALPMLGEHCKAYSRFRTKVLGKCERLGVYLLDPRFPEVREYLIQTCENAIRNWNLDGFKFDFIDAFRIWDGIDPAVAENYQGRDCKTIPEGADILLAEMLKRLKQIKTDVLVEFRQNYMGPAVRKYGNMMRAADCPNCGLTNRTRTIDLRLTSGSTAVHSDMLNWYYGETPGAALRQFLNILFSVPQISVRLAEIPDSHKIALKFWIDFWYAHRDLLLNGYLTPYAPELNYPLVTTETENEFLTAVYEAGQAVPVESRDHVYIVNASGTDELVVETPVSLHGKALDVFGVPVSDVYLPAGLSRIAVPDSGLLDLRPE